MAHQGERTRCRAVADNVPAVKPRARRRQARAERDGPSNPWRRAATASSFEIMILRAVGADQSPGPSGNEVEHQTLKRALSRAERWSDTAGLAQGRHDRTHHHPRRDLVVEGVLSISGDTRESRLDERHTPHTCSGVVVCYLA